MAERLFDGANPAETILQVLSLPIRPPRSKFPDLPEALEAVVMRGADREPDQRFTTAREMAAALEAALPIAPAREIAEWVQASAGPALAARARLLERIEVAVAAPPTASERTRIEGLRASLADSLFLPETARDLESGPRPILGARSSDDRGEGFEPTQPQKERSEPTGPSSAPASSAPPVSSAPPASAAPPPRSAPPAPAPPPGSLEAGARRQEGSGARVHRIPVRIQDEDDDRGSLRERLAWPVRLLVLGVALSLVDFALRQAEVTLPFRPIWAAEILVVVGVVWAFVRVAVAPRE